MSARDFETIRRCWKCRRGFAIKGPNTPPARLERRRQRTCPYCLMWDRAIQSDEVRVYAPDRPPPFSTVATPVTIAPIDILTLTMRR